MQDPVTEVRSVSHTLYCKVHFRSPSKVHSTLYSLLQSHRLQLSFNEEARPTTLSQRFVQCSINMFIAHSKLCVNRFFTKVFPQTNCNTSQALVLRLHSMALVFHQSAYPYRPLLWHPPVQKTYCPCIHACSPKHHIHRLWP